ncbi:hypothetical protein [Lysinibacillus sp. Bpr_S20]|uniref:hypothetical protein n=1 Tax=Lysinibacillus sp. Bpr_S20 TaxID=2933964 RepID=UPI00201343A7|nr:hypothetical protein [Lysinibacillus sp. Bpr_S20]MCL1698805.1 hypothetical protein [Lysinibacillus sp. Bpr_S20]
MDIKATSDKKKEMLFTKYGKLSIEKEENPKSKFYVGILDRFSKPLSIKEAENLLISYTPSNKRTQNFILNKRLNFLSFLSLLMNLMVKNLFMYFAQNFSI